MLLDMILLISPKGVYATQRLFEECKKASVEVECFDIQELAAKKFEIDIDKYETLYVRQGYPYFHEAVVLARRFAEAGKIVVDANIVEGIGDGKGQIYKRLSEAGIPIPQTNRFLDNKKPFPYILKWVYGFGGKEVHLVKDDAHVQKVLEQLSKDELLAQEFIKAKYEYKVITIGYRSVPVVLRLETNKETFKPDFQKHQTLNIEECVAVVEIAEKSAKLLGRELSKVDILEDFEGHLFVLEVNRWPGLKNFESLTGYNAVEAFVKYIDKKEANRIGQPS